MPDPTTPDVTPDVTVAGHVAGPVGESTMRQEGTARVWRLPDGTRHRLGGPAVIDEASELEEWWQNGQRHRADGPAYTSPTTVAWWFRGRRHRDDGEPASENLTTGDRQWHVHGRRHRIGGPAITGAGFPDEWWVDDRQHRLDGPAVDSGDGYFRRWKVHGEEVYDTDPLEELLAAGHTRVLELALGGWTPDGPSVRDLIAAVRAAHA